MTKPKDINAVDEFSVSEERILAWRFSTSAVEQLIVLAIIARQL